MQLGFLRRFYDENIELHKAFFHTVINHHLRRQNLKDTSVILFSDLLKHPTITSFSPSPPEKAIWFFNSMFPSQVYYSNLNSIYIYAPSFGQSTTKKFDSCFQRMLFHPKIIQKIKVKSSTTGHVLQE